MKSVTIAVAAALLLVGAAPALAAPGGAPDVHDLEPGQRFGDLVSGAATGEPGAVADHIHEELDGPEDAPGDTPPDQAYGYWIMDGFGDPYGLLLKALMAALPDGTHDEAFPPAQGAMVFWETHSGFLLIAV